MAARKKATKKVTAKKVTARKKAPKKAARRAPRRTSRRQPESLRLSDLSVSITVNDLARSREWYCDILGFHKREEWVREGKVVGMELVAGRCSMMIGQDDFAKGRDRMKGIGSRFYLETGQDIDALAAHIKAKGVRLDSEPADQPWGARTFSLTDPDGFKFTVSTPS